MGQHALDKAEAASKYWNEKQFPQWREDIPELLEIMKGEPNFLLWQLGITTVVAFQVGWDACLSGKESLMVKYIAMGSVVRDPITNFSGTVVARTEWLWGCVRLGVQASEVKDGKPVEESWFDEQRLVVVRGPVEDGPLTQSGGPAREGRRSREG
jgi:hypothetical protein